MAAFPIVAVLGPRQVGKTTLARQLAAEWDGPVRHFDLEDPDDQARLADPAFVLRPLTGLVVLDEIQMRPDLFPLLRALADRPGTPARFLILGSAAPELLRHTAETLAGRVAFHELDGLALEEIASVETCTDSTGADRLDTRWLRGGFPRALLATDQAGGREWTDAFIRTYLERDLPQLGIHFPALTLRRFWIRRTGAQRGEVFFWGVHTGAGLDLLVHRNGRRLGFEIKLTRSPTVTASMRSAREVLALDGLWVVCHGEGDPWPLAEGITAVPAMCLASPHWRPE